MDIGPDCAVRSRAGNGDGPAITVNLEGRTSRQDSDTVGLGGHPLSALRPGAGVLYLPAAIVSMVTAAVFGLRIGSPKLNDEGKE